MDTPRAKNDGQLICFNCRSICSSYKFLHRTQEIRRNLRRNLFLIAQHSSPFRPITTASTGPASPVLLTSRTRFKTHLAILEVLTTLAWKERRIQLLVRLTERASAADGLAELCFHGGQRRGSRIEWGRERSWKPAARDRIYSTRYVMSRKAYSPSGDLCLPCSVQ